MSFLRLGWSSSRVKIGVGDTGVGGSVGRRVVSVCGRNETGRKEGERSGETTDNVGAKK